MFSYVPYFAGIISGKVKPHAFSWTIWGILAAIAFIAQRQAGAGSGSWINGLITFVCAAIAIIAAIKNEQKITKSDLISFVAALLIIPVWLMTKNIFCALIMVATIDTLGFYPTLRKSWLHPFEENMLTFALNASQYLTSVFAMNIVSWTTTFYPSWIFMVNASFVIMVLWRRKKLRMA